MAGRAKYAALLERVARAAEAEGGVARALEWADASDERRSAALVSACIVAFEGARASGFRKPALRVVPLPRPRVHG